MVAISAHLALASVLVAAALAVCCGPADGMQLNKDVINASSAIAEAKPAESSATKSQTISLIATNQSTITPMLSSTSTTTTAAPVQTTTDSLRTDKERQEAKRLIFQLIKPSQNLDRIILNRPTQATMAEYAPESIEARVAEAAGQFGLNFIRNSGRNERDNVVISPLSLQSLMNMVLLGCSENSTAERELVEVLGYGKTNLFKESRDRLTPHEAIKNVHQAIMEATHLPVSRQAEQPLLNTNTDTIDTGDDKHILALLQTSDKSDTVPLTGQVNFTIANLVLTNKNLVQLHPNYEKEAKNFYGVEVEEFSQSNGHNVVANASQTPIGDRVNSWVKNITHNQIQKLVGEGDLDSDNLALVLLNAAHFKGRWLHTFNSKATHEAPFYNFGQEQSAKQVDFMRQKGVFGFAEFGNSPKVEPMPFFMIKTTDTALVTPATKIAVTSEEPPLIEQSKEDAKRSELTSKLNCSVLMLPFSLNDGQELNMVIFLPTLRDGIADLQAALDGPTLNEVYKSLTEQQVVVELPKFTFESSLDAKESLKRMGLKSVFEQNGQLGRMFDSNGKRDLAQIDKVLHKAKISVDESGAEASAASMISVVTRTLIMPPPPSFVAEHPFLFVIRHNKSNMPLFMGRVSSL